MKDEIFENVWYKDTRQVWAGYLRKVTFSGQSSVQNPGSVHR